MESAIAGIGLNINQKIFLSDAPNPVSLSNITAREYDLTEVLSNLVIHLNRRYNQLLDGNRDRVEKDYQDNLYRSGVLSEFSDQDGVFRGKIDTVNTSGQLRIIDENGKYRYYYFKEVIFL
jgi:BirA family transcriptional regulator, biotin operon repressor / biotin---[acetyl-CoA-carboxylase] ligase